MGKVLHTKLDVFMPVCHLLQTAQMKEGRHGLVALKDFGEALWKREAFLLH